MKKKFIDAELLQRDLIDNRHFYPAIVKAAIESAPAADVVGVVRCKDCKHRYQYEDWDRNAQESFVCYECRLHKKDFGCDGFCSCGEAKMDGKGEEE